MCDFVYENNYSLSYRWLLGCTLLALVVCGTGYPSGSQVGLFPCSVTNYGEHITSVLNKLHKILV